MHTEPGAQRARFEALQSPSGSTNGVLGVLSSQTNWVALEERMQRWQPQPLWQTGSQSLPDGMSSLQLGTGPSGAVQVASWVPVFQHRPALQVKPSGHFPSALQAIPPFFTDDVL